MTTCRKMSLWIDRIERMSTGQSVNYSKLFAQLIDKNGLMDDTVASFLYYMFPNEMFVRALSLIESTDMFIYVFDSPRVEGNSMQATKSSSTDADKSPRASAESLQQSTREGDVAATSSAQVLLVSDIYQNEAELLYRLIVKPADKTAPSIYVDLSNWFCSCDEYSEMFFKIHLTSNGERESALALLVRETDDVQEFSNDKFAQLDAHSLCKQRYIRHDKLICPHLLAYSILMRSSQRVLEHFAVNTNQVLLIPIGNMDEWLNMHINIVV